MTVSVVIKALNEERRIAAAIESALAGLDDADGEVILADGGSTDRTVEIASRYPIRIVRLNRPEERSCGAGVQLGFQYSAGKYICLVDGDMTLHEGFIGAATRVMEANPEIAGVGGLIIEREEDNLEFVKRGTAERPDRQPGSVDYLDCGGVYRRSAIDSVEYFGDCNLHSREELDLGVRLRNKGWKLIRIKRPAIDHFGHMGSAFRLLSRRTATRFSFGDGEVLRAALGRPHLRKLIEVHGAIRLWFLVLCWWAAMIALPMIAGKVVAWTGISLLISLPIVIMSLRYRSMSIGLYSVAAWNVYTLGFLRGLWRGRVEPTLWIDSSVVKDLPNSSTAATEAKPERLVSMLPWPTSQT